MLPSLRLDLRGFGAAVEAGGPQVEQERQVIDALEEFDVHGAPELRVGGHGGEDDRSDVPGGAKGRRGRDQQALGDSDRMRPGKAATSWGPSG